MATVSPLFVSNLCCCGHDLAVHVLAVFPNIGVCGQCFINPAVATIGHNHDFTPYNELYPRAEFPQVLPVGCVSSGGNRQNTTGVFTNTTTAANPKGNVVVNFANLKNGIYPGMTFTTEPPQIQNRCSYRILTVDTVANRLTIPQPGLLFSLNAVPCYFNLEDGGTWGGGLPPNGQRAG